MLAGARHSDLLGGLLYRLVVALARSLQLGHLLVEQALLRLHRPIGRADQRLIPRLAAGVHHALQGVIAPAIHLQTVAQLHRVHLPVLRQLVPGIHQRQQLVARRRRLGGLRLLLLGQRLRRLLPPLLLRLLFIPASLYDKDDAHDQRRQEHHRDGAVAHRLPVAALSSPFSFIHCFLPQFLRVYPRLVERLQLRCHTRPILVVRHAEPPVLRL